MVKLKKISKDKIDRISNLPNHLISQILSLLATKNAIATSILSTRWKFLWTSITTLTFDEKTISWRHKMKRTKFAVFINKVFILIPPFQIQNFCLKCSPEIFDPLHLHMWISLIASTVGQLDLHLGFFRAMELELEMNHFRFNKLVVLKLHGGIGFKIPAHASVCFPSLQTLHLSGTILSIASNSSVSFPYLTILHFCSVKYADKESVHKLFSGCPVLHSLYISLNCSGFSHWALRTIPCLTICIPSLTRLETKNSGYGNCDCEIQTDKFCQLEFLSIYGRALKVNGKSWPTISTGFHFLKRLELEVDSCRKFSDVIKHLLERMDNLEHLVMKRTYVRCNCSQKSWWTEPLNVAECLLSRVTSISFTESGMMDDCHDELELIRYLLKNARVMKLLKLCISSERKHEMIQKISTFPQSCKIEWT